MRAALLNDVQAVLLHGGQGFVADENLRIAENAVERRPQFVAHVRQKLAFGRVRGVGGLAFALRRDFFALRRLFFAVGGVMQRGFGLNFHLRAIDEADHARARDGAERVKPPRAPIRRHDDDLQRRFAVAPNAVII